MIINRLLKYSHMIILTIGMTSSSFATVDNIDDGIRFIISLEGGFQNNPKDKGNYINKELIGTNMGITPKAYKYFYNKTPTVRDIKYLTKTAAFRIYKKNYMEDHNLDQISDLSLQISVMDFGITSSPRRAIRYLQMTVGVRMDGQLGKKTLDAIKNYEGDLIKEYNNSRRTFIKNQNNKTFQKGWLHRVDRIENLIQGC